MTQDNKGNQVSISVIIPTLNAESELPLQLERLHGQTLQADEIIVIDSASDDATEQICRGDEAVSFIRIRREDYDHGGTRDIAARRASGDIIVFLTQDALPVDKHFLANLTAPIINGEAAICTGRQIPRRDASHMEALVRAFNYPDRSFIRSESDLPRLGIKTFFCSDVCCAYDRSVYLELGGFEHPLKTNEDMFFAARAINSGYRIAYAADAVVYHSHNFTLRQQFERNYVQGYEIAKHDELLKGVSLEGEGMKLVRHVATDLIKQGHPLEVIRFGADCAARLAGSRLGRRAYNKKSDRLYRPCPEHSGCENGISKDRPAVCVLVSTYNGEKYLQQQLDSLYAQTGADITIMVRDDGSTDSTRSILEQNAAEHECLSWYAGDNAGSAASFLRLIADAPQADYYALCDQDDVWDSDKIECTIAMFRGIPETQPALYYSNLRVVDEELGFHRLMHGKPWVMKNKYSALADYAATGCTMVFNRALCELLRERIPAACKMHDEWIYLTARFFGTVVYDFEPHISYRQHSGNVLGARMDGAVAGWLIQKVRRTEDVSWQPRSVNAKSFLEAFEDMLTPEDKVRIRKMAEYKSSLRNRLALLSDTGIHGRSVLTDLKYRIKVITGKQ